MSSLQLSINQALVQHYFLEVDTDGFEPTRDAVMRGGAAQQGEQPKVGPWRMFAWLDRPAIWAIRPVEVTSGLDTFLLETSGLEGMRDVSELVTCALNTAASDEKGDNTIKSSWHEFAAGFSDADVIFMSFLWPNWDALLRPAAWGGAAVPARSQILAAVRQSLALSVALARDQGLFAGPVSLLLCASVGDCELVLYGHARVSRDLDLCLYILTQMGSDVLARHLFGADCARASRPWPVFRSSRTELALDLDSYLKILRAARGGAMPLDPATETDGSSMGGVNFDGEVYPEISLTRGRGPIPNLKDRLARVAGLQWQDRAVFGREDFIVSSRGARQLKETVELLARFDAATGDDPAFPRRSSIRMSISLASRTEERLSNDTAAATTSGSRPTRGDLFGADIAASTEASPRTDDHLSHGALDIEPIKRLIVQLREIGWREDLRIIERMTERCATLLRSPDTRRETRQVLRAALERLVAMCRRLEALEATAAATLSDDDNKDSGDLEGEMWQTKLEKLANSIRLLRSELLQSGMSLDRVLAHHSKGAVSLLLHRASQARGAEHIGSELGLSMGLSALFRFPVRRLQQQIRTDGSLDGDPTVWLRELITKLDEVASPIIYASQEPDFYIRPELTLLRVPRWALWYPAAASHLIHELGHSLAVIGSLDHLLRRVLNRLHFGEVPASGTFKPCPFFEQSLLDLGMPTGRDELRNRPAAVGKLASQFFWDEPLKGATRGPDPEKLQDLEEIMCDVVARLFSYNGDSTPSDQRQLWDCFDYLVPFTARRDPEACHFQLLRLLSAHIAIEHLREIRRSRCRPLAKDSRQILWEVTRASTITFQEQLREWAEDFRTRRENQRLPPTCHQAIITLPDQFAATISVKPGRGDLRGYQLAGHLIALVLSIPPLQRTEHQSLFKATRVWGSLVGAAWGSTDDSEVDALVISQLHAGQVPSNACQYPERLPRAIAWSHRAAPRREVPAQVRMALSFYLADLSHL